jgi:hypothetical protein
MNTGAVAFFVDNDAVSQIILISPQVEGFYGDGILSRAAITTIENPLISSCGGAGIGEGQEAEQVGIYFAPAYSGETASLKNSYIVNVPTAIKTLADTTIQGITIAGTVTTILAVSGGYYKIHGLENHGSGAYTNNAWVAHGLPLTPSTVTLTPRSNVAVWVNNRNATHFQVGVASGTPTIDWDAKI